MYDHLLPVLRLITHHKAVVITRVTASNIYYKYYINDRDLTYSTLISYKQYESLRLKAISDLHDGIIK